MKGTVIIPNESNSFAVIQQYDGHLLIVKLRAEDRLGLLDTVEIGVVDAGEMVHLINLTSEAKVEIVVHDVVDDLTWDEKVAITRMPVATSDVDLSKIKRETVFRDEGHGYTDSVKPRKLQKGATMEGITVETKLEKIDVYRYDPPEAKKGHVDVRIRLLRNGDTDDVIAVSNVRVYFASEDVTIKELIDSAFHRAHLAVRQIAELSELGRIPENPESLWIE